MTLAGPILAAAAIWWSATASVLWLINRKPDKHLAIGRAMTLVMLLTMLAVFLLRDVDTVAGAYLGFLVGVILCGLH